MTIRTESIHGAIWGLLIGDALGVPYEFHAPDEIPTFDEIEYSPPPGFSRSHDGVPPATWSDDGAHALCLLASLLYRDKLDLEDLMRRMTNWYEFGYMAADGKVFDVGVQTSLALLDFREGMPAAEAGPRSETDNGNGSLMRVLPLALWHRGSDEELILIARQQSLITHGHIRAQLCCALYCLWAKRIIEQHAEPWQSAVETLRQFVVPGSAEEAELELHIRPDDEPRGKGTGYVVDSLNSVRQVMRYETYEEVVKAAIALGNDTDTTAAIAGGLAGLRCGLSAIPERWRGALRGTEVFVPLLRALCERIGQ